MRTNRPLAAAAGAIGQRGVSRWEGKPWGNFIWWMFYKVIAYLGLGLVLLLFERDLHHYLRPCFRPDPITYGLTQIDRSQSCSRNPSGLDFFKRGAVWFTMEWNNFGVTDISGLFLRDVRLFSFLTLSPCLFFCNGHWIVAGLRPQQKALGKKVEETSALTAQNTELETKLSNSQDDCKRWFFVSAFCFLS